MTDASESKRLRRLRGEALRFAGLALAINTAMAVVKIGVGLYSGSHAVLASSLYSINDLLSAIAVAVSLRFGVRRPNERYPFGYGNAEFIAVGIVSLGIGIGVLGMFFFSVADLVKGVESPPHFTAMTLSAASMVVCYLLARHGHKLAVALDSPALATGSEHHYADALGCLAALAGVGGAMAGYHSLDRIAALVETIHLVALSGALLARSTKGLMDAAIPEEDIELVMQACGGVAGVERVDTVRSRQSGSSTWVDVVVAAGPGINLERAAEIRAEAEAAIRNVLGHGARPQVKLLPRGMTSKLRTVTGGESDH
jgi:cation diffusion facilitator family transporter